MSFRDQQDHLLAKNAVLEEQLREINVLAKQERKLRRRDRWNRFADHVKIVSFSVLVAAVLIGAVYGLYIYDVGQKTEAVQTHQHALGTLRAHVPSEVDRSTWLRCIDRCARFGAKSAHNRLYSEGIVVDTFADYGDGAGPAFQPVLRMSVGGPWLDSAGHTYRSYLVSRVDTDPPGTVLRVGDRIRITEESRGGEHVSFTFKKIP